MGSHGVTLGHLAQAQPSLQLTPESYTTTWHTGIFTPELHTLTQRFAPEFHASEYSNQNAYIGSPYTVVITTELHAPEDLHRNASTGTPYNPG